MTDNSKCGRIRVRGLRKRTKRVAAYLERPVLVASFLVISDSLGLFLGLGFIPRSTLVLILFLEGGLGLLVGVVIALSATPSAAKLGEMFFGTAPWSRDSEKGAETVGWKWLVTSSFLILIGFGLSLT